MNPELAKLSIPEIHKQNQILWFALMAGVALISCVMVTQIYDSPDFYNQSNFLSSSFMYVALGVSLLPMVFAKTLVEKKVQQLAAQGLKEKFIDYRTNFVFNAAIHEGPALICVVLMFLEQNFFFLVLVIFNLIFLYLTRPTLEKFQQWYQLTGDEKQELKTTFPNEML